MAKGKKRVAPVAGLKTEPGIWLNRIVRYGAVPPDQLLANEKNWRTHPPAQRAAFRWEPD